RCFVLPSGGGRGPVNLVLLGSKTAVHVLCLVSRVRGRLKQFHEIAGWVFNQNLPATRSSDDVIAKHNSRVVQDVNIVLKVAALNDYSVPPTRFRSPAVGHRLRSPSGPLGWTQHELHILSRED